MPLASWERDGLKTALVKAGLPADDVTDPKSFFWRFETLADIPAGSAGWRCTVATRSCDRL